MVMATLRVVVPAPKRGEVLQAFRSLRGPTEAQAGCCGYHIYRDDRDENTLVLIQEWATQVALDRYIRSDLYRIVLAVIETASEAPEVRFDTIAERAGLEIIAAAREGHGGR
jgi:quinol monooxygenase YgiN